MPVGNPVTDLSTTGNFVPVTRVLTINGVSYDLSADRSWSIASPGGGSVTSVAMTVPTGFAVAGSPITTAGTLAVTFASGYSLPTTIKQSNWDDAYTWVSNFPTQTGNAGKFLYTNGSVLSWQQALLNPFTVLGQIVYSGVSGSVEVLNGNTTTQRLYLQQVGTGSSSAAPTWGGIVSTDVSGQALTKTDDTNVLLTLGGTPGNSVLNAVSLNLSWAGQLAVSRGGTGAATLTGVLIGNGTSAFTAITGGPNQILRVNSTATGYEFFNATYLTNPMTLNGDMIAQIGGVPGRIAGPTAAVKHFLTSTGTGSAANTPTWQTLGNADIPGAALTSTNDTNVQITLGGTPSTAVLRATSLTMGWTGQLAVGRGGTGASTLTGVVIGNGTSNMTAVAGTAGQFLRRNTANTAYEFRTLQGGDIAGSELTKTDDTNVQMTLGGTPASALLQPVSLTLGWTGQLAVGRGGTGASTLTGVLIGNGTSAVTGVTGTSGQLLRRNVANTAYEFFTASLLTGNGTANFVPIWTSSTNILDSPLSFVSGEANFGSNKLVAGNTSATNGSIMLQDNYSTGHLGNIGTMFSGGNLMMGYCVTPSTTSSTGFLSSTGIDIPKSALVLGTDIFMYTASSQAVTIGSAVTMTERFKLTNNGQLRLSAYTSTSSFPATFLQGFLGFTSTGAIVTAAVPGGVSGTQNYLAKFDSTGVAVGNSRIVDDGTNFFLNGATSVVTGLNLVGNFSSTDSNGSVVNLRRSAIPTSGLDLALIDAYGITTGSTYQRGAGIEFKASENWSSTNAGTEVVISTTPNNTIAPADMFIFQNNGTIRFIGRGTNPIGAAAGTMYYNSTANQMRYYNGTSWITF